jgi:hypothetical protein
MEIVETKKITCNRRRTADINTRKARGTEIKVKVQARKARGCGDRGLGVDSTGSACGDRG